MFVFLALAQGVVLDFNLESNTVEGKSFMRYFDEPLAHSESCLISYEYILIFC